MMTDRNSYPWLHTQLVTSLILGQFTLTMSFIQWSITGLESGVLFDFNSPLEAHVNKLCFNAIYHNY